MTYQCVEEGMAMTEQLQSIMRAARTLSTREKLELLQAVSNDLQQLYQLADESTAFWAGKSIDELALSQRAPVVSDVRALRVDFWPDDESADAFNSFVSTRRHANGLNRA